MVLKDKAEIILNQIDLYTEVKNIYINIHHYRTWVSISVYPSGNTWLATDKDADHKF